MKYTLFLDCTAVLQQGQCLSMPLVAISSACASQRQMCPQGMRTTAAVPVWQTTHIDPVLFEPLAAAALAVVADADAVGAAAAAGLRGGGAYAE